MKKIAIISDHAGFELKSELLRYFNLKKYIVKDMGPKLGEKPISYAVQGSKIGLFIKDNPEYCGVAICGTGLGISFAVNRIKGVRGARVTSIFDAKMAKKHNDANIIVFGGRITTTKKAVDMFNSFTREEFEGGRHKKRIDQLDK